MLRIVSIAALLTLSISIATPTSKVLNARQAAVNIMWQDKNTGGWHAICSGSFVDLGYNEPTILTAGHCVDDFPDGSYGAKLSDGQTVDLVLDKHLFSWPAADYAVLKIVATDQQEVAFVKPLKVGKPYSKVGQHAYMWSGPIGTDINYYEGYYSGLMSFVDYPSEVDNMPWVIIDSAPGSSGTVMLNSSGEAVGILVGGFTTETKLWGAMLAEIPK